jgi:hypothetical protein
MDKLYNVRVPDAAFNQTADMLRGPPSYVFPHVGSLHQKKTEMKEEPDVIIPDKPMLPDPEPYSENVLQKLIDWLSKPLNLSLVVSIIALLLVILF